LAASDIPGLAPLIAEYDGNGKLVAKYHHDGGLIAMTRGNQSYWYVFEAIGSVRQLTDTQSQVPDAYFYDAWGNELTSPYSQVSNPFRYVGKHGYYLDTQSALMLLGVRYYTSAQGRFLNSDPLRDGINWYAYNDPVNKIDPEGTHMFDISSEPLYCKAAGNNPRADGMKRANRCFCEVSKLARELINNSSPRAKLCNLLGFFGQCRQWLECMDQCIFQDWAQWWVRRQIGHIFPIPRPKPIRPLLIRPPGVPQPDECWGGKIHPLINFGIPGTIDQLCRNPNDRKCCYAMVACEKHSLFICLDKCRRYQIPSFPIIVPPKPWWCCLAPPGPPVTPYSDCLQAFSLLPQQIGIDYNYLGSLQDQIRDSMRVCCDSPFWLR